MSLGSFFKSVEQDVVHIFTSSNTAYDNLVKEEQYAATWVSGSLAIINQNLTVDSDLLIPIIQSKFPNVTLATIESTYVALTAKIATVQSTIPTTLSAAITAIQGYLLPKSGNDWIVAVQGLFNLAATLVSPSTPLQKFAASLEYVYNDIIKPLLGIGKPVIVPAVATTVVTNAPAVATVVPNVPVS